MGRFTAVEAGFDRQIDWDVLGRLGPQHRGAWSVCLKLTCQKRWRLPEREGSAAC
jgi:hypothetical protein